MAKLDLTIQVLDLSPKVTFNDLNVFFSYCGTVEKITLERKEDQSPLAFVTFRQPYAWHTAHLLNDAVILGRRIRILSSNGSTFETIPINMSDAPKKERKPCTIPVSHCRVEELASKGCEKLNKVREELDHKYMLSEKGRLLNEQTRSVISVAGQTAERVGEAIVNNEHFSAGALWVSGALDKAAKCAAELGSHSKRKKDQNSSPGSKTDY